MVEALSDNTTLRALHLGDNGIGDAAAHAMLRVCQRQTLDADDYAAREEEHFAPLLAWLAGSMK